MTNNAPLNADDELREQIHSINRLGNYKYTPSNVVLVTIEDVVELVRQVAPYTMSRLDEATADRKKHELQARREGHRDGFVDGVYAFSNYYMDASLAALRAPIMPHIAKELVDEYKYPVYKQELEKL